MAVDESTPENEDSDFMLEELPPKETTSAEAEYEKTNVDPNRFVSEYEDLLPSPVEASSPIQQYTPYFSAASEVERFEMMVFSCRQTHSTSYSTAHENSRSLEVY